MALSYQGSFSLFLMDYNISRPSLRLSEYVKYYWSFDHCIPSGTLHTQRVVPTGLFELVLYLNDKPVSSNPQNAISDYLIVSGQQKSFYELNVHGKLSLFAIYFHPHGLSSFLNIPLKELFNQSIPLKLILKDIVNVFEDRLSKANSFEEQIKIAEELILNQIQKNKPDIHYQRIQHIIYLINQKQGNISIDVLASEACLSRKQFERIFLNIVGISPKQFLKIIRFQNAIYQKSLKPDLSLTELSHLCGYYDQAHMIHDFKSLSGYTPRQFLKDTDVFSDYFG